MINISSENGKTRCAFEGDFEVVANECLNIIPALILEITGETKKMAIEDGDEIASDAGFEKKLALDLLSVAAGELIFRLIGGDLDEHIDIVRANFATHVEMFENKDNIKKILLDILNEAKAKLEGESNE